MPMHEQVERLHRDLGRLGNEISRLRIQMQRLRQRTDQLAALRETEPVDTRRLAQLESVLDVSAVSEHLQAVVARAPLVVDPVAHLTLDALFPTTVYAVLVEMIPPAAFFEGAADQTQELRVPQQAGPLPAIVAWTFVTELVLRALGPALVARFESVLAGFARATFPSLPPFHEWGVGIALTQGRLVRHPPGAAAVQPVERPWDFLTGVLGLGQPHESGDDGVNTAVVCLGPAQAHQVLSKGPSERPQTEWYTYEFGIGPTRDARRTLTAKMSQHDAAIWSTRG